MFKIFHKSNEQFTEEKIENIEVNQQKLQLHRIS